MLLGIGFKRIKIAIIPEEKGESRREVRMIPTWSENADRG